MNTPLHTAGTPVAFRPDAGTEARLRALDLVLATTALAVLLPLLLLALAVGRRARVPAIGRDGAAFRLHTLVLPDSALGRRLGALGAHRWPALLNVLAGEMAWVGPRVQLGRRAAAPAVRPGLVNSWQLRRRVAVDFDDEAGADAEDLGRRGVARHLGLALRGLLVAALPASRREAPPTLQVCDVRIDNLAMGAALARVESLLDTGRGALVCFVNPACVNIAAKHRGYRRALRGASLVLPDGIGIKLAGDILGTPLRQNVNGTDLFPRLLDRLAARRAGVFLLGGRAGVPEKVAGLIAAQWPAVRIAGVRNGYFAADEEGDVVAQIRASGADVLLVARGVPSQELFVARHADRLGVRVAVGVGGLFDFVSGRIPRAPQWLREIGGEWVYRLIQEPGRMWQRYLVGNFTFLARVLLQRWGLRRAAVDADAQPADAPAAAAAEVRAVLFATPRAPADLPVPADEPAALLPLGHATLVERQIEQLVRARVRHIAVVACDAPERLRALLGNGERWGATIEWHLAKDPAHPYAALGAATLASAHRLVVGHTDTWLDEAALQRLVERDEIAVATDPHGAPAWTGWASGLADRIAALPLGGDRRDLARALMRDRLLTRRLGDGEVRALRGAADLLALQSEAARSPNGLRVPGSWVRMPWGAASPLARVDPGARIDGPALVGPGCVVEAGAHLGADVWLSRDVVVSAGTHVDAAVVLPGTYIAGGLDLTDVVVNGPRVQHLRHGVETVVSAADGLLLSLTAPRALRPGWPGRIAAAALVAAGAPVVGPVLGALRLAGRPLPWIREPSVHRRQHGTAAWAVERLACARVGAAALERPAVVWAMLADVAAGRRSWFGARMRTPSQWYALNPQWQDILASTPVGLLHAPAWRDAGSTGLEAEAAADIYYATRAGWRENLRIVRALFTTAAAAPRRTTGKPGWAGSR